MATAGSRDKNQFVPGGALGSTKYYLLVDTDGPNKGRITVKTPTLQGNIAGASGDRTVGFIPLDNSFQPSTTTNPEEIKFFSSAAAQKAVKNQGVKTLENAKISPEQATQTIFPNTAAPPKAAGPAPAKPAGTDGTNELTGAQLKELEDTAKGTVGRDTSKETGPDLRYPIKGTYPCDYISIEMRTYQKSGFQSEADTLTVTRMEDRKHTRLRTIYLPIQSGIVDSISVDWGNGEINPITAQFANLAMGTMVEAAGKNGLGGAAKNFAYNVVDVADKLIGAGGDMQKLAINYFTERAIGQPGLLSRSIGGAINNNLELLFNGPTLRAFTFNFKLTPRSPDEAKVIKEIIRVFKRGMSPALSESGLFLSAPNVFKLKYVYTGKGNKTEDHPYLNRIKVAALRDFSVNYTPDGNYMTYGAESDEGEGSMTQYDLSMTFGEIDPVYAQDYDDKQGKTGMGW